jgi:hypothetical protein
MKEALITCLTRTFQVEDMGLDLRQGDVVYRPEAVARGSRDLKQGMAACAVSVRYVERFQVEKKQPARIPAAPATRMSRPNMGGMLRQPKVPVGESVDTEEIAQRAEAAAAQAAEKAIEAGVKKLEGMLEGQQAPAITQEQLEAALKNVLPTVAPRMGTAAPADEVEIPTLIPDGIVDKDAKATLKPTKEESSSDGLDAATAALKKSRAKKPVAKAPKLKKDGTPRKKPGPKKKSKEA